MNKNDIAAKFTSDIDEKMILCRVLDKYEAARDGGYMTNTVFLTDRARILVQRMLNYLGVDREAYVFDGGYDGASRCMALFLPEYILNYLSSADSFSKNSITNSSFVKEFITDKENTPLEFVRVNYYKEYKLTHRDLLGSLMGLGISREAVGDILVSENECFADIVISSSLLNFLLTNFESAGRARLTVKRIERAELTVPEQKTLTINDTVASLRVDGLIAAALGFSRDKASGVVSKGLVEVDHFPCVKGERLLSEGSEVSVRGFGKFKLEKVGSLSKKGRIFVEIKRFI